MDNWIQVRSGKKVNLSDPQPDQIDLSDMAHALGRMCRFTGHTRDFYSVAQHLCLTATLMPKSNFRLRALALVHDAAEAYVGDVSKPLRRLMEQRGSHEYELIEATMLGAVYARLGMQAPSAQEWELVKWADESMLLTERRDLMEPTDDDWSAFCSPGVQAQEWKITPWTMYVSSAQWLGMVKEVEKVYSKH